MKSMDDMTGHEQHDLDEPRYTISVVGQMVDLHPQTLRNYEEYGLVVPQRTPGNFRLYTERDVQRLRKIVRLTARIIQPLDDEQ